MQKILNQQKHTFFLANNSHLTIDKVPGMDVLRSLDYENLVQHDSDAW